MSTANAKAKTSDKQNPSPKGGSTAASDKNGKPRPANQTVDKAKLPTPPAGQAKGQGSQGRGTGSPPAGVNSAARNVETFQADDSGDDEEDLRSEHSSIQKTPLHLESLTSPEADPETRALGEMVAALDDVEGEATFYQVLSSLSSWSDTYPEDEMESCDARIEHDFRNKNRLIEAALATDAFLLDGTSSMIELDPEKKHTRLFEAVGHYVPNLVRVVDGRPVTANPDNWVVLTGRPSAFRMSDGRALPAKGWVRYRLTNGKHAEMRSRQKGPPFAIFPPLPDLAGFACHAVRSDLSVEELIAVPVAELLTPGQLFDAAIHRAGGVEQAKLLPYLRPRPSLLPDSTEIEAWLKLWTPEEPTVVVAPEASAREALLRAIDSLSEAHLTEGGASALDVLKTLIHPSMDEESANRIYEYALDELSSSSTSVAETPTRTKYWASPSADVEEAATRTTLLEYYVSGEPAAAIAEVAEDCEYVVPYPAFLVPERASPSAISVLSHYPAWHRRIGIEHATFSEKFPWYALSATPRKQLEERGILSDGHTWFERMVATVDFAGPVFLPRRDDDREALEWSIAFNTAWLEEVLLLGSVRSIPRVYLWRSTPPPPSMPPPPAAARGIGVSDGKLVLSPLVENRERWEQDTRQDSRLLFPLEVVRAVVDHPDIFSVVRLDDYLALQVPLQVRARINGQEHESFFYPGMKLKFDAPDAKSAFVYKSSPQSVDEGVGGVSLHLPKVPGRNKKVSDTDDSEWGIPDDETAAGWQLKSVGVKKPHSEIEAFGSRFVITKIGNWDSAGPQLLRAGLTDELIKQLYSVHWQAANSTRKHPVVQYHHPSWTDSLRGKPVNRRRWFWPTGAIAPCPWLSTNDAGQLPLFGKEAEEHLRKVHQKENRRAWLEIQTEEDAGTGGAIRRAPARHVPKRGRGGATRSSLSREQAVQPSDDNWW